MRKRVYLVGNDNIPGEKRQLFDKIEEAVKWIVETIETKDKDDNSCYLDYYIKSYLIDF